MGAFSFINRHPHLLTGVQGYYFLFSHGEMFDVGQLGGTLIFMQVQLIGFCTTNSLFLVYEYIENGNLDHHLHRKHSHGN